MVPDDQQICLHLLMMVDGEQKIKHLLQQIDNPQQQYLSTRLLHYQCVANPFSSKQLSDWQNRYEINPRYNKNKTQNAINERHIYQMPPSNFIIYNKHRKKPSLCPSMPNKLSMLPSPINVKFGTNPNRNIKRSKLKSSYDDEQKGLSIYEVNYRPLQMLYESKKAGYSKVTYCGSEQVRDESKGKKLPKTERVSGIMRMMKRNQQIRSYKRKYQTTPLTVNT